MHPHSTPHSPSTHAVVIGGGIAGLLASRVLADRFAHVTIVERDRLPASPLRRPGTPQAAHQHVLLQRGLRIVERRFPGFQREAEDAGAPVIDMAADVAWLTSAGWGVRFSSDLKMLGASRELLEWLLRRRIASIPSIAIESSMEVAGLTIDSNRVAGVRLRARDSGSADRHVRADFVVDASGRYSRLPDWLAVHGYERPRETVIDGLLGYASRVYRVPADRFAWRGAYVQPAPPHHTRGGVLFPHEGDRWHLTLAGIGGDYPPTDEASFIEFARSLRSPILYDAIRDAEPLTPIAGYRATENRMRHYEAMTRWPEGVIAIGDAVCAFNPVYAQGMTTAAIGVEMLADRLAEGGRGGALTAGFGRRFQRRLAQLNANPWRLATSEDLRLPQTVGGRAGLGVRLMHRYIDRIVQLTTAREDVRLAFLRTMNMLDAPAALFAPRIVRAVAAARRKGGADRSPSRMIVKTTS